VRYESLIDKLMASTHIDERTTLEGGARPGGVAGNASTARPPNSYLDRGRDSLRLARIEGAPPFTSKYDWMLRAHSASTGESPVPSSP
jgi:hypothetical protein